MKRFFIKLLLILIALGALFILFVTKANYSDGEKAGNILSISRKGVLIKTWEGKLDLGILQAAQPKVGTVENTVWPFSVASDEIALKIQEATKHGNRVVLKYEEKFMKLFWVGESKYIVTDVQEIPGTQNQNQTNPYQTGTVPTESM